MNATLRLGGCIVRLTPEGVSTMLPGGAVVLGTPHDTQAYLATARALGYGDNVARMNWTHETTHSLIAALLGLSCSPVFHSIAGQASHTAALMAHEESAVLALEAYANALGVDLIDVARAWPR